MEPVTTGDGVVEPKIRRTLGDKDRAITLKYAQNYLDYTAIYLNEK
jgi:hypothetical protein